MQDQAAAKTKRTTRILIVVLALIIAIAAGLVATPFILAATVREFRTIEGVQAPIQLPTNGGSAAVSGTNWTASLFFLAEYEIQGLVVGTDDYNSGSLYDRAVPRDISIAWGDMAAHNNLVIWQRGEREMTAEVNMLSEWVIGKNYRQLFPQFSNNHLIAKNKEISQTINTVKRGDYVKMKGYLVDAKIRDKSESGVYYRLTSSLVRDDEGDGSCEVMYVTDIEFLD